MTFNEYQKAALKTCLPSCWNGPYLALGLVSEIGELAGKYKKRIRGDEVTDADIIGELGDICWYAAVLSKYQYQPFEVCNYPRFAVGIDSSMSEYEIVRGMIHASSRGVLIALVQEAGERVGVTISEIFEANINKLRSRQERGQLQGDGDER